MANRHFGKLADVWKHLVLTELLAVEQPLRYAETHAGSAAYPMVHDAERRFGVLHFLSAADVTRELAASRYAAHLRDLLRSADREPVYPGSALLAMLERGAAADYLLCDLDGSSVEDLERWADRLDLGDNVQVVPADGMTTVAARFLGAKAPHRSLVHIDPFDAWGRLPGGRSAVELAAELARAGVGLVYWYGYDDREQRSWAMTELAGRGARSVWCGDMLIVDESGGCRPGGDLGTASTPGTGFGVVVANVSERAIDRCGRLGEALASAYRASTLPDGGSGRLDFRCV